MYRWYRLMILILLALLASGCAPTPAKPPAGQAELVVSAAASLTDALRTAQTAFEAEETTLRIRFNFGSSGALAQQIEQGAPVDLFLSAGVDPMQALLRKGLVAEGTVESLALGRIVLIRPQTASPRVTGWESLARAKRIAIANPQHVPAGRYGREVLESLGLWKEIQPQLILAEDVRQVLRYVESGEVDAGLVYQTDAASAQKVVVVATAPEGSHSPVTYPMAIVTEARQPEAARRFAEFLRSPRGREILARHGFEAP